MGEVVPPPEILSEAEALDWYAALPDDDWQHALGEAARVFKSHEALRERVQALTERIAELERELADAD